MLDSLQRLLARLMTTIHVNKIHRSTHDATFIKRRRPFGTLIIFFANRFLALARSGIHMFVRTSEWREWESHCLQLLYPNRPPIKTGPGPSITLPEIPGTSLRQLLHHHQAESKALTAAARELRRAHQIPCSYYDAEWSHGDLHLDNILYNPTTNQATLIDFDTRHDRRLPATRRHADDLHVMLLELISLPGDHWRRLAHALIKSYNESHTLAELAQQLSIPRGVARIFWYTRTSGSSLKEIEQRLHELRKMIEEITASAPDPAATVEEENGGGSTDDRPGGIASHP
jgi:serine/threonine protein kinase